MKRDELIHRLRAEGEELERRFGIRRLALFGSYARDEAGPESDVDLLVEFAEPPTFDRYMGLAEHLEELLGSRVDLVTAGSLKPRLRRYVERDLIRVA